jgi:release factor glutamine methyltransferase
MAFVRRALAKRLSSFLADFEANAESWRWFEEGLGWGKAVMAARGEEPAPKEIEDQLDAWFSRRKQGEPWAYILGWTTWRGRRFCVTPATLIPRPETELVLEAAVRTAKQIAAKRVVDVGTGAGILGVALALETALDVTATDVSTEALAVAKQNAHEHNARLTFACGDLLAPVSGSIDLIVSNPPYVDPEDAMTLQRELSFEPKLALFAPDGGLGVATRLLGQGFERNAWGLVMEIGAGQGDALRARATEMGWQTVKIEQDTAGHDRVLTATAVLR